MSTATLTGAPVTQLTFPWGASRGRSDHCSGSQRCSERGCRNYQCAAGSIGHRSQPVVAQPVVEEVASSLTEALEGDRIGRPFKMGSVMFRLLKSYGITDEEIAAGVAAYNARKAV